MVSDQSIQRVKVVIRFVPRHLDCVVSLKDSDADISGFELPFLFRTGLPVEAFRAPVIKYIASTSASQVASVASRYAYQDHTDFAGLLFELFEACHGSKRCARVSGC